MGTWYETRRQANISYLALIAVQRAYVTPTGVTFDPVQDKSGNIAYWQAHLVIQDTGVTPTSFLRAFATHMTFYHIISEEPDADLYDPPLGPQFGWRLGPGEKLDFGATPIFKEDVRRAELGKDQELFWGVAEYKDTLGDDIRHVTKFCYILTAVDQMVTGRFSDMGVPIVTKSPGVIPCGHHNCTDEECKYDYKIVRDPLAPKAGDLPEWLTPNWLPSPPVKKNKKQT